MLRRRARFCYRIEIEFQPGNTATSPNAEGPSYHYIAGENVFWEKFNEALDQAPLRKDGQRDPNREQAKRIAAALGSDVYVTQFHVGPAETGKIYDIIEKLAKEGLRLKDTTRSIGVSEDYGRAPSLQKTGGDIKPFLIIPPRATEDQIRPFFEMKK